MRERERLAAQNARHDDNEEEETTEQPSRRISGGSSSQPARRDSTRLDAADKPSAPYPHVFTTTRSVKQDTIDKRWAPLTPASVAAASETLTLAHRPIMQRLAATGQKRQYASSALSLLHRRISRKLQRGMPFPPAAVTGPASASQGPPVKRGRGRPRGIASNKTAGVEAEMDFESVLDGSQALERQLDPLLHAVELLRREKEHMERELELDYQNLRNLEAGARGQARVQRDQIKKAHALVPEAKPRAADDDVEMVFDTKGVPPGGVFKVHPSTTLVNYSVVC